MELYQAIKETISENPEVVADYRQGKKEKKARRKAFNFLFGKIMKMSKSSADTEVTTRILLEKLGLDREDVFDE